MKLTADTPPNGDFVRYLEAIERASPGYQMYQAALAPHTPGAVASTTAASALADRLRAVAAKQTEPARTVATQRKREDPLAALRSSPLLRQPAVQGWAGPLLQKLERALADAANNKKS
jgi:hypothetical protein